MHHLKYLIIPISFLLSVSSCKTDTFYECQNGNCVENDNSSGYEDLETCISLCASSSTSEYNCVSGNCEEVSNGSYSSLSACESDCSNSTRFSCFDGNCLESTSGSYSSFSECQSNCVAITCPNSVTDIEGNSYPVVKIGSECWMASNLKTSKYRDGTDILNITSGSDWIQTQSPAWCYYDNNASNDALYGKLYNWLAIDNSKGICPDGWHVASSSEWSSLTSFVGSNAALKLSSTSGWFNNNNGTNEFGFNAKPGGQRTALGFERITRRGTWWTSSKQGSSPSIRFMDHSSGMVFSDTDFISSGFSCRCVKD